MSLRHTLIQHQHIHRSLPSRRARHVIGEADIVKPLGIERLMQQHLVVGPSLVDKNTELTHKLPLEQWAL